MRSRWRRSISWRCPRATASTASSAIGCCAPRRRRGRRTFRRARRVQLVTTRASGWTADVVSASEWLGFLQAVRRLIGAARALEPADLVPAGHHRRRDRYGRTQAARRRRGDEASSGARRCWQIRRRPTRRCLGAAAFGVVGAVPSLDATQWAAQVAAAAEELTARAAEARQIGIGFHAHGSTVGYAARSRCLALEDDLR